MILLSVDQVFQTLKPSDIVVLMGIFLGFYLCLKTRKIYTSIGAVVVLIASFLTLIKSPDTFQSIVLSIVKLLEKIITSVVNVS